jgi:hypothetical protein
VSLVAHGFVEILYPDTTFVRDAARIYFDSIPGVHAVLAFPWGRHSKNDDLPAPVRRPRGFPKNMGTLALSETTLYVDAKEARTGKNPRAITVAASKRLQPLMMGSYTVYLDPDVKSPTWLTYEEVVLAANRYTEHEGHLSYDLEAVAGMMRQYHSAKLKTKTRLIVWFT